MKGARIAMTSKRIGTITAGIFMIVLGAILLLSLTVGKKLSLTLIYFWPAFIILLGVEILYHHYKSSKGEKLRYDVASMFVLLIFGLTAIGLYSLQASGILSVIDELSKSSLFTIDASKHGIPVDSDINKIVIENSSQDVFTVRVQDRNNVAIDGNMNINAASRKLAEDFVNNNKPFSVTKQGHELIIKTRPMYAGRWFLKGTIQACPITVTVPSNIALDVISNHGNTSLIMDNVASNCFIRQSEGGIDVTVPEKCDLDIMATAQSIEGNVKFEKTSGGSQTPDSQDSRSSSTGTASRSTGSTSNTLSSNFESALGKGGAKLSLISPHGNVIVCTKK
jgi:hypothetical protein